MKICHKLCDRINGTQFWCFSWFPANSLLCVIYRYTVYCKLCHSVVSLHLDFLADLAWALVFMAPSMSFLSDPKIVSPKGQESWLPKEFIFASTNENKIASPSEMILTHCKLCHRVVSLHLDLADLAWALVFMAHLCHSYQITEIVTPSLIRGVAKGKIIQTAVLPLFGGYRIKTFSFKWPFITIG